MPRGLGEDPLSRKRKGSRRTVHPVGMASGSALASPPLPDAPGGLAAAGAPSRSFSHNDVFFTKRSIPDAAPAAHEPAVLQAEPVTSPPVVAEEAVSVAAAPEAPASEGPIEVSSTVTIPEAVAEPAPQATPVAAPAEPASYPEEIARPDPVQAQPAAASPAQDGGLLKKLFGRFRHQ